MILKKQRVYSYKKKVTVFFLFFLFLNVIIPNTVFSISIKQEEELSKEFLESVFKHLVIIKDPHVVNYINSVGNKLVAALPPQPFKYHFYVIKQDVYNAFAGPGANIFINSGLIEAMETEEELAGILGHEIAHAFCRHISLRIKKAKKTNLTTLAGLAAGILLGIGGSADAASAVIVGSVAAGQSYALAYSRENERQADQIGFELIISAGYDGTGLVKVLKKIRDKNWFGPEQIPTYLTTHPATKNRIINISTWLENSKNKIKKKKIDSFRFKMVQTKISAEYGDKNIALDKFSKAVSNDPDNVVANYGQALVLARTDKKGESIKYMKKVLEKMAFNPYVLKDAGKIYFSDGQYKKALECFKGASIMLSSESECNFYIGRSFEALGQLDKAIKLYQKSILKSPENISAYYFLGQASGQKGNMRDAHFYLGLYYKKKYDYKNALFHFKRGMKYSKNDPEIKQELKNLKKMQVLKQI